MDPMGQIDGVETGGGVRGGLGWLGWPYDEDVVI